MVEFTAAQQSAIDCDAKNILVSAAAGSGKTAVLTERIMRHIRQSVDIDKLLVVTFTESASAEMRERITKKLQDYDTRQLTLLTTADISTIHAFCRKLVKEHFQVLDLDPAFRVGDEGELNLLRTSVMDALFEAEYEREDNTDFLDLADVYGGKAMDGRLDVLVRKIYDFLEADPFPKEAAKRYAAMFESVQDTESAYLNASPWANIVREELSIGLDGVIEGLKQAIQICHHPEGPIKYAETLETELEAMEDLRQLTDENSKFETLYETFLHISWGRLPSINAKDQVIPELKSQVQRIRDNAVKKKIKSLTEGAFFAPPEKMQADLAALYPRVAALMKLATRFAAAFAAEKRARNILDFTDLEHFAIKILYPNGPDDLTPNEDIAKYHEVLVDEYQDSNLVQDMILSAVAERRFMVGDVKQSIYRFRRANPGLFREKYAQYLAYDGNKQHGLQSENVRIDLSDNFRSRPEVLNAVNFFFSQLMCNDVGEVDYDDSAALHPGRKDYPAISANKMQIEILDQAELDESESDEDEEAVSNIIAETRLIAKCINELLQTRQYKCGDMAILTRGLSGMAGEIIEELKNHGIDAVADMNADFFQQTEVKTALAFLKIIDNPLQDIDLITILMSPVYDFTADELLEIRQFPINKPVTSSESLEIPQNESTYFYDHLTAYANHLVVSSIQNPHQELHKVQTFLTHLQTWRDAAIYQPISRLIGLIYDTTKYSAHVLNQPSGIVRQANLRLLLERAIEFEETSLKGLFHFINYIERLSVSSGNFASATEPTSNQGDRVRLMTIHKSKGLEFPVVFCSFLGKKFNTDSEKQPVILHSEMGIGPYYVNTDLRTRSNTLARFSLSRLTRRESLSEELRCLYVAMTRAEDLLILTARSRDFQKSAEKWADFKGQRGINLPVYYRRGVSSCLDWIMPCLLRHRDGAFLTPNNEAILAKEIFGHPAEFKITVHQSRSVLVMESPSSAIQPEERESTLSRHSDLQKSETKEAHILRPYQQTMDSNCSDSLNIHTEAIPSKLSISEIKRLYDITPDSTIHQDQAPSFAPPNFMKAESGPTPMELGSALHTVVEHIDYNKHTTPQEIESLIQTLTEKNLLSPEIATFIDRAKIETLIHSPLADRIRKAGQMYREVPFVLAIAASEIYPENLNSAHEKILVHGIIDCYFQEDNKIVLLDFKSGANPKDHKVQMDIYKKAIAEATALEVKEVLIYSFALGEAVSI